jgi:hypothetical protein
MGRPRGWAAAATGRAPMRPPGRPPVARREDRQRFWAAVSCGLSSEDAGVAAGQGQALLPGQPHQFPGRLSLSRDIGLLVCHAVQCRGHWCTLSRQARTARRDQAGNTFSETDPSPGRTCSAS